MDSIRAEISALIREGDDHFYGPWKGGTKGAGGRSMTPEEQEAADAVRISKQEAAWMAHQSEGVVGVDEALVRMRKGEVANVAPESVGPLLDKVAETERGVGGEHLDLTELSVNGTLKFGGDGLGLERSVMPQIPKESMPDFMARLKRDGIKVKTEMVDPKKLAPIQKEISTAKAGRMLQSARTKKASKVKPVLISKDNYVLDGHHHWASMTALSFERPTKMPVVRVDMKHRRALAYVSSWTAEMGFATKALNEADGLTSLDWTVYDEVAYAVAVEEASDDHFYGSWSGGSKSAGGRPEAAGAAEKAPAFASVAEANAWAAEHMKPDIAGQELRAAKEYIGGNYTGINNWARYKDAPDVPRAWRTEPGSVKHLDSLIAKHQVPTDLTVTRNCSLRTWGGKDYLMGLQGATITEPGFMSTNIGTHATGFGTKAVKLNIKVPKGTNGVWLGGVSKFQKKEAELLLGRDTRLRIDRIESSGGKYNVYAEVVS